MDESPRPLTKKVLMGKRRVASVLEETKVIMKEHSIDSGLNRSSPTSDLDDGSVDITDKYLDADNHENLLQCPDVQLHEERRELRQKYQHAFTKTVILGYLRKHKLHAVNQWKFWLSNAILTECRAATAQVESMQAKLEAKESNQEWLTQQNEELTQKLDAAETEAVNTLHEKQEFVKGKQLEMESIVEKERSEANELHEQYERLQQEFTVEVDHSHTLQNKLQAVEDELVQQVELGQSQLQIVGQELALKAREVLSIQHELDSVEAHRSDQVVEIQALIDKLASLEAEMSTHTSEKHELVEQIDLMKKDAEEASMQQAEELETVRSSADVESVII